MSLLRFDGRVAVVTGAGGGLGRCYALLLASRGASVVVNDLGGDSHGSSPGSARLADNVVREIRDQGGSAVSNYDSVEDGDSIVKTAIDNYGRLDILINNAGILRDRSFLKMTPTDWDMVHRVHLRGSYLITKAAWPHMRKQNFGRILMVSSTSGMYGNFGQTNYSAAKMGLFGLSNTLSLEGAKFQIQCNTLVPTAISRMTEGLLPADIEKDLKPDFVAPVAAYLCHESCSETGQLFEVACGWAAKVRWEKSRGACFRKGDEVSSLEDVRDKWAAVSDFSNSVHHATAAEATSFAIERGREGNIEPIVSVKSASSSSSSDSPFAGIDLEKICSRSVTIGPFQYAARDVILYALGVGAKVSDPSQLKFLYEGHNDFCTIPTFGVLPSMEGMLKMIQEIMSDVKIHYANLLHGEQYIELFKPMPTSGSLTTEMRIVEVLDKRSGAVIVINATTYDENKERLCFSQVTTFAKGAGRFGGKVKSQHTKPPVPPPNRSPDLAVEEKTSSDQAAIYRLSGDYNPLHIDPDFAAVGGFSQPILHGLSSFGHSVRHVMEKFADNDPARVKSVKGRFSRPVVPGHTLKTEMWKEGSRIYFRTSVLETGDVSITGGYVDLTSTGESGEKQEAPTKSDLSSDAVFAEIGNRVRANPSLSQQLSAVFFWKITKDGNVVREWTVDLKGSPPALKRGPPDGKPDITLTISDENFVDLVSGKLEGQQAFFKGQLKIQGNVMLAQKMSLLTQDGPKL